MLKNLEEPITAERAIEFAYSLIQIERLNNVQDLVLRQSYQGQTYEEIAEASGYSIQHIRDVGYKLWQILSTALGEKVNKSNLQSVLNRRLPQLNCQDNYDFAPEPYAPKYDHPNSEGFILPESVVSIDSPFYIKRPPIEERCCSEISKPGALVRLRAPRRMGKTSLMIRVMAYAAHHSYHTVRLNLSQAEGKVLSNLERFLRWFCANLTQQLKLELRLNDYWDEDLGSKVSCTNYLRGYILPQLDSPLILALDEVDRIFEFPQIARDFLPLLRFWHEEANNIAIWQKLRLIVVHATEVYVPLNLSQSPFNVGLPITLPEFTVKQVQDLAQLYGLDWTDNNHAQQLMTMVGGHPYLVQLALYHLQSQDLTLERLLQEAPTHTGIYSAHLRGHLGNLQAYPQLTAALKKVITTNSSQELESIPAYKLESMGLVKLRGDRVTLSSQLYRLYFSTQLS